MPAPDFEAMSLDELADYKVERKAEINAIREDIEKAHAVWYAKFMRQYAVDRYGLDAESLTESDMKDLLRILKKQTPKPAPEGSVTVTPEPAVLTAEGN